MKKTGIYLALLACGILLGYLLFGGSSDVVKKLDQSQIRSMGRWTCSMHPQVEGEENGTCPLCAMDLVYMEDSEQMLSDDQFQMTEGAMALANILTSKVGTGDGESMSLRLSGTITTNVETDAIQTTLYEGRLDALYPNYVGKKVRKGQEIGKVYSPELYLAQDKLLTAVSYKEKHEKLYNLARNTYGLWKMTDEEIDRVVQSGKPIVDLAIYSDVTGTVTEVLAKEGEYLKEGTPIFRVSNLNTVWAVFDVYEEQLPLLRKGEEVEVEFAALPDKRITGKIDFIEPILDTNRRTAMVRVVLQNGNGELKPGMFAKAFVKSNISSYNQMLTVPESALLWTGKRSIVYVKPFMDQPVFQLREVELGQHLQNGYVVLSGLNSGDEVVTQGAFTVDAAAQLTGNTSMMNRQLPVEDEHHEMPHKEIKDIKTSQPLHISQVDKIDVFLSHYFELKDALVGTDFERAREKSSKLNIVLNEILRKSDLNTVPWDNLNKRLKQINSAKEIEEVRKHFKPFSKELIDLVKNLEGHENTIYVQFCPMADNNKGAFWLSLQEEIRNPYYGDKMLICGVVKEQIN